MPPPRFVLEKQMSQLAVSYGSNAVPVNNGGVQPDMTRAAAGAVPSPGSGINLEPEIEQVFEIDPERIGFCQGNAGTCRARPAKGTEWCVGHLRSRGEF